MSNKNFEQLVEEIKMHEGICDINIYCGDVNIDYKYDIYNQSKNIDSMDILKSDGEVIPNMHRDYGNILSIEGANYVVISGIKTDGINTKIETYSIIFDPASFGYFQSYLIVNKEKELFNRIIEKYLVGNLEKYETISENKNPSIYPIYEKKPKQMIREITI